MCADWLSLDDDLEEFLIEAGEVVDGFRDRYGEYRLGEVEADPHMSEYEERLSLAASLR